MIDFCEELLWEFVRAVEPTSTQKANAQRSHNYLRDILMTGNMEKRILGSYLSGSYARRTAIAPLDDVDVIILIDPEHWKSGFLSAAPSASAVLKTFERAIRYLYPESALRVQRRSIGLKLWRMDLDVVPAIPDSDDEDRIWVPDIDDDKWIVSAPRVHSQAASAVNKARDNLFIPLVKLLKHWNTQLPSTLQLKSFAIETLAVRIFQKVRFDSLVKGVLLFFDFIASFDGKAVERKWEDRFGVSLGYWGTPSIPDIAGTGSNLVGGMTEDQRSRFIHKAVLTRDRIHDALAARTEARAEALLDKTLGFE